MLFHSRYPSSLANPALFCRDHVGALNELDPNPKAAKYELDLLRSLRLRD